MHPFEGFSPIGSTSTNSHPTGPGTSKILRWRLLCQIPNQAERPENTLLGVQLVFARRSAVRCPAAWVEFQKVHNQRFINTSSNPLSHR